MSVLQQILAGYGAAPAFSPSDISGLKVWLKADALALSDGDPVSSWTDSSGLGNHATQGTSGNRPTYQTNEINGKSVVRFVYTRPDFLSLPDLSALTAGHAFVLMKRNADPPGSDPATGLWRFGTSGNQVHVPYTDNNVYDDFGSTVRKSAGNPTPSFSSWFLYDAVSASGNWTARVNNASFYTTATNTVGFRSDPKLGSSDGANYNFDGDWAEFLLYDAAVSGGNYTSLISYMNSKYGLSF